MPDIKIDKNILKNITLLYVEDDDTVREDLSSLLSNFFKRVYTAEDGIEGLSLYKEKLDDIDIIVSDINMPRLTGIQMLEKIREFDKNVPVILATAYSDNDFLIDAIKLKVSAYIIKPLDIRKLMESLNDLAKNIHAQSLIKQQNRELKNYKDIIFTNNIVIKIDKQMKIEYVNNLFCQITGFDEEELLQKELSVLKNEDSDIELYKKIYKKILNNEQWHGELKNITKDGNFYYAETSVITTLTETGEITGALIIQKDETQKVLRRKRIQSSLIKDKSEIFQKSKQSTAELHQTINSLKYDLETINNELNHEKDEKNKYIYLVEKYALENKKLLGDISQYRKVTATSHEATKKLIKATKENTDLKVDMKRLYAKLESISEEHQKELKQQKVNYEVKIDDLEKALADLKEKFEESDNVEVVSQKLAYWKEKAKTEAKKNELFEREIINFGDKNLMTKLFGSR